MATIKTLKLRGLTAASATIGTLDIAIHGDGMLRFTDAAGNPQALPIKGGLAALLQAACTGTGGYTAPEVIFDRPALSGPGVGGRSDS